MNRRALVAAPTGLLVLLLLAGCAGGQDTAGSPVATTVAGSRPPIAAPVVPASPTLTPTSTDQPVPTPTVPAQPTASVAQPKSVGETATVTNVVDGDTIDVRTTGRRTARIRVIGIDTPERGECNFGPATYNMKTLVAGRPVVLSAAAPGKDTTDRYGRWLRYVDVNGVDAGLGQITAGLAVARYDSRDGYGRHHREARYIAAQAAATLRKCGMPSTPEPTRTPAWPGEGAIDYGTCGAAKTAGAVPSGGYRVGRDVEYGFYRDGDNDGHVCE
jgi:endonuclease YncB( thermonuclease family)